MLFQRPEGERAIYFKGYSFYEVFCAGCAIGEQPVYWECISDRHGGLACRYADHWAGVPEEVYEGVCGCGLPVVF